MKTVATSLILISVLILSLGPTVHADDLQLSQFRVFLNNGQRFDGRQGTLSSDRLVGQSSSGHPLDLDRKNIIALDRRSGSKAGTGFTIGAGAGLALALLSLIQAEADPDLVVDQSKVFPVFAILTMGGGLVGAAIGHSIKTWEHVPLDPAFGFDIKSGEASLSLTYNF